jgi:hypothetical protein
MRTLCGRVLSCATQKNGFVVRLATLNGKIYLVSLDMDEIVVPALLAIGFPVCALALFRGYYKGINGFKALDFEVIPHEFAA